MFTFIRSQTKPSPRQTERAEYIITSAFKQSSVSFLSGKQEDFLNYLLNTVYRCDDNVLAQEYPIAKRKTLINSDHQLLQATLLPSVRIASVI